jgi:hypothetical protein
VTGGLGGAVTVGLVAAEDDWLPDDPDDEAAGAVVVGVVVVAVFGVALWPGRALLT